MVIDTTALYAILAGELAALETGDLLLRALERGPATVDTDARARRTKLNSHHVWPVDPNDLTLQFAALAFHSFMDPVGLSHEIGIESANYNSGMIWKLAVQS